MTRDDERAGRGRRRARAAVLGIAAMAGFATGAPAADAGMVDDARLLAASDADEANWIAFGQGYDNQRFSELTAISRATVSRLAPAWIYQTGTAAAAQTHPLVVDGTMYVTLAGNDVVALDAASGTELWHYRHKSQRDATLPPSNRGAAVAYGKVFEATDDGRVVALDQKSGAIVWDAAIAASELRPVGKDGQPSQEPQPFAIKMAPVVFDGLVIAGVTGMEYDVEEATLGGDVDPGLASIAAHRGRRAFVFALNAETGEEVWRFYTTKEGGWEGDFRNEVAGLSLDRDIALEQELAGRYGESWAAGGAAAWGTPSVDPDRGLLFFGTGDAAPDNIDMFRPGDNLYANGVVALDVRTGAFRWFYQEVPHDRWVYDAASTTFLFDATVDGRTVPAIGQAGKVGWLFVMDRETGALLYTSDEFVPHRNTFARETPEGIVVSPGSGGGASWSPVSYDPTTGYVFVPAIDQPMKRWRIELIPTADGMPRLSYHQSRGVRGGTGTLTALDTHNRGKVVWQALTPEPLVGGVLATAGGIVFTGEANGHLSAFDSATGARLWQFQTGARVGAPPMSYAVGGRQYVAVATGAARQGANRAGGAIIAFALVGE